MARSYDEDQCVPDTIVSQYPYSVFSSIINALELLVYVTISVYLFHKKCSVVERNAKKIPRMHCELYKSQKKHKLQVKLLPI